MSALTMAAARWRSGDDGDLPAGVTVTPVDIASGHAASTHSGRVHIVADAARITDGKDTRLAAVWLCGGDVLSAFEVPYTPDLNVCPMCTLSARVPRRPCVYFAYGTDDELLYVGSSGNVAQRIRGHASQTAWWGQVARLTFAEYDSLAEARAAEADAIWNSPGIHNKGGTRQRHNTDYLRGITVGEESAS